MLIKLKGFSLAYSKFGLKDQNLNDQVYFKVIPPIDLTLGMESLNSSEVFSEN